MPRRYSSRRKKLVVLEIREFDAYWMGLSFHKWVITCYNWLITGISGHNCGNGSFPSWWSKAWVCFICDLWLFSQSEIHHDWGISVGKNFSNSKKSWVGRRFCLPPRTVSEPKQDHCLRFFFKLAIYIYIGRSHRFSQVLLNVGARFKPEQL